jgi:hypothetical protein
LLGLLHFTSVAPFMKVASQVATWQFLCRKRCDSRYKHRVSRHSPSSFPPSFCTNPCSQY